MKQQLLKTKAILCWINMCPQYPYYKAFISQKNVRSPTQALFTKISYAWPVALSMCLKSEL